MLDSYTNSSGYFTIFTHHILSNNVAKPLKIFSCKQMGFFLSMHNFLGKVNTFHRFCTIYRQDIDKHNHMLLLISTHE